jgi:hypothetical protein
VRRARASKATAGVSNASPAPGLSFASPVPYYSDGKGANAAAIADVNGDGFPDLVVTNWCSNSNCTGGAVSSNDTVSLNITTMDARAQSSPMFKHQQQLFYAILLPWFLGMVSMAGRRRTLRGLRLLALIVVLGLSPLWAACGGSSNSGGNTPPNTGTPTGTGTVTVSATSGNLQGSTKITLTMQ